MRVALLNPAWHFDGSIYFGCREPHLPLPGERMLGPALEFKRAFVKTLGEDFAGPWQSGGGGLPFCRRPTKTARRIGLQYCRFRMHDLHRKLWTACAGDFCKCWQDIDVCGQSVAIDPTFETGRPAPCSCVTPRA